MILQTKLTTHLDYHKMKDKIMTTTTSKREIIISEPTPAQDKKAREIYITRYNELRLNKNLGYVPKAKILELMRELGEWDDSKDKQLADLRAELSNALTPLRNGGISLQDAKDLAAKAQIIRSRIGSLNMHITDFENQFSYESHADDAKYQYLLYTCSRYKDDDSLVFETLSDYENCANKDLINEAGKALNLMLYGDIKEMYRDITENKFLIEYGFMTTDFDIIGEENKEVGFKPFLGEDGLPIIK